MGNAGLSEVMAREEANRRRALGQNKQPTVWQHLRKLEVALGQQREEITTLKTNMENLTLQIAETNKTLSQQQLQR